MRTFVQLCRVTAMRALREPVTVIFAVLFAPAYIGCMGLIFGNNPARTLLGPAQKAWLKEGLAGSRAAWKVVGNQAMIMSLDGPTRNEINKDQWDGYGAERREILQHVADRGAANLQHGVVPGLGREFGRRRALGRAGGIS